MLGNLKVVAFQNSIFLLTFIPNYLPHVMTSSIFIDIQMVLLILVTFLAFWVESILWKKHTLKETFFLKKNILAIIAYLRLLYGSSPLSHWVLNLEWSVCMCNIHRMYACIAIYDVVYTKVSNLDSTCINTFQLIWFGSTLYCALNYVNIAIFLYVDITYNSTYDTPHAVSNQVWW